MSMMVNTGTPARYMLIAELDRFEWVQQACHYYYHRPRSLGSRRRSSPTSSCWQSPMPTPPEFQFAWTQEAAEHNLAVLRCHDMSLAAAIRAQPFSSLSIGSKFRPPDLLAQLFGRHQLWPRVDSYLRDGLSCTARNGAPRRPPPDAAAWKSQVRSQRRATCGGDAPR